MKNQSDKKTFQKSLTHCISGNYLRYFVTTFNLFFQVARHNRTQIALQYIQGLLTLEKGKANMERMQEEILDSNYRAYQHFLTNSDWDYKGVLTKVLQETSQVLNLNKKRSKKATGLIIDESAHLKKGSKSVAVGRQYAGLIGKVDNCQVGVYASLVNDNRAGLVNERLFIPKNWISDKSRCKKAGIPVEEVIFRTKPELALDMIDEIIKEGAEFDWIGGDGLYGHNKELRAALNKRELLFVLDVHKDENIFLEKPEFVVAQKSGKRGRPSKISKPSKEPIRIDKHIKQLKNKDWTIEKKLRKTQKGWKKLKVHCEKIWVFHQKSNKLEELTLIITQTMDGTKETKYSFSNGEIGQYRAREFAYFQIQRYWVERTFDDAKNEIGMSDYQVRKWKGWHHHHALVFMANLFLLKQKIEHQDQAPLMSIRDARILVVISLFGTEKDMEIRVEQMKLRHQIRQKDIERRCKT